MVRPLRILWVKTGLLHPLDTGGKIRTYHMLRELSRNHEITYLTLAPARPDPDAERKHREYCRELALLQHRELRKFTAGFYLDIARNLCFSRLPYAIDKYSSPMMRRRIADQVNAGVDLVVCDFLAPAVNFSESVGAATLLFQHNFESQIWERHAREQTNPLSRAFFGLQWKRMAEFEKQACRRFDGVVTVSREDEEALTYCFGLKNILGFVPTGVDADYFLPQARERRRPQHLVFLGSMDWLPNEDAGLWFAREIYPRIKAASPGVTLSIVGRNPGPKIVDLGKGDPSIIVTGTVDDVRPHVAEGSVIVVPLRIGGGTRIKIFEGMAMGVPIVSTTIGAEGLPVRHGENILLADTPEAFGEAVLKMVQDRTLADTIADNALRLVRSKYTWSAVAREFEGYCTAIANIRRRA